MDHFVLDFSLYGPFLARRRVDCESGLEAHVRVDCGVVLLLLVPFPLL